MPLSRKPNPDFVRRDIRPVPDLAKNLPPTPLRAATIAVFTHLLRLNVAILFLALAPAHC